MGSVFVMVVVSFCEGECSSCSGCAHAVGVVLSLVEGSELAVERKGNTGGMRVFRSSLLGLFPVSNVQWAYVFS